MLRSRAISHHHHRRGVLVPIVAVALMAVMGAIALVLDRMWIDMARMEMRVSAEAAALAAARELVSDDLLRTNLVADRRIQYARQQASFIAAQNQVAGVPLALDTSVDGDVRLGRLRVNPGRARPEFVETLENPDTAVIIARRTQRRNNPIVLLFNGISPSSTSDLTVTAEASIDNRIQGIVPLPSCTLPTWPIAILSDDPTGNRLDTWQQQIDLRQGTDLYSFDERTGFIGQSPDGIPEIVLSLKPQNGNVVLLPFGSQQPGQDLARMIQFGVNSQDLTSCGGGLIPGPLLQLNCLRMPIGNLEAEFQSQLGVCRTCLLYSSVSTETQVQCPRLVAGRILRCDKDSLGNLEFVFQPGVLETRTALLASASGIPGVANPYIYHLSLTQ